MPVKKNVVAETLNEKGEGANGVIFDLRAEQLPNPSKYPFSVIVDPERESDKHAKGQTHVMFRIGNSKYLTVLKDNLFYAPIEKEVEDKRYAESDAFKQYLDGVSSLSGMTSGAKDKANSIMLDYCQFLVEKLIQYGIYEYDLNNFTSLCGTGILIENTDSYRTILKQKQNVDTYAQDLTDQRDLERSSRSQWSGGIWRKRRFKRSSYCRSIECSNRCISRHWRSND